MARIVVVGSVAVDEVVALSEPLRPYTHLSGRVTERRLGGGAANTGRALVRAGHDVTLVSAVGTDELAEWLLVRLREAGIGTDAVARVPGPSTRSLVLVDATGERTVVNVHRCVEAGGPARLRDVAADAIYVRCRELDVAPLLEARLADTLVLAHVPPTAPHSRPAHFLVGSSNDLSPEALREPWTLGRAIAGAPLRAFVVTRGEAGAESFTDGGSLAVPAQRVTVVDSTGAGDAFAAGLLHALTAGAELPAALETACAWGARAVSAPRG